ncbi:MAG: DNA polymerase III subunit delta [Aliivibrio sp.]|uniref:DNA polymerase III subunit delta n=1 Tax=Aliivibrio sp. TaxID=1872443 RepID=UPI001A3BCF58|nr:DNA polymerase III subunit delta [Aliivibrio sp.]
MRIFPEQLLPQLNKNLHQSYLLFGNEPLLKLEAQDQIRKCAFRQGFEEKYTFTLDKQIDWNLIIDCCQALSLFSSRQIIELEVPDSGLSAANANQLKALIPLLHNDLILILIGPRVTKAQENTQWFKKSSQNGIFVPCNTPDNQHLPRFIQNRCHKLKLIPDPEAIQILAQWHEGNLLALAQSLEKLALLYPDGKLTLLRIEAALNRNNHFTPFQLTDALLAGKAKRAQRIVRQLEAEGVELIILLRTIQKDLFQLLKLHEEFSIGLSQQQAFDKYRIWQNKREFYQSALQRLSTRRLQQLILLLTQIEIKSKSEFGNDTWPLFGQLCIDMCSIQAITI